MVNKVFLLGRIGKDAVIKHMQNENSVAEFSLATTDSYKDKEGKWVENTEWHNIKIWGKGAFAEMVEKKAVKGALAFIEGKIATRSYDDKDGNKRYITEIVCNNIKFMPTASGASDRSTDSNESSSRTGGGGGAQADDDLPF